MSHAINYRPMGQCADKQTDIFYIDHDKHTPWQNVRSIIDSNTQSVKAQLKLMFDRHTHTSLYVKNVRQQLRSVGISGFDLLKPETYYIARVLKRNELILAAICGKVNDEGTALLVVTNRRIIYLNQIPLFTTIDEVGYGVVTGISSNVGKWDATITLHTGIKDFQMHSVNVEAANNFIYIVEKYCIDNQLVLPAHAVAA